MRFWFSLPLTGDSTHDQSRSSNKVPSPCSAPNLTWNGIDGQRQQGLLYVQSRILLLFWDLNTVSICSFYGQPVNKLLASNRM